MGSRQTVWFPNSFFDSWSLFGKSVQKCNMKKMKKQDQAQDDYPDSIGSRKSPDHCWFHLPILPLETSYHHIRSDFDSRSSA
jgi:hypothetical protein